MKSYCWIVGCCRLKVPRSLSLVPERTRPSRGLLLHTFQYFLIHQFGKFAVGRANVSCHSHSHQNVRNVWLNSKQPKSQWQILVSFSYVTEVIQYNIMNDKCLNFVPSCLIESLNSLTLARVSLNLIFTTKIRIFFVSWWVRSQQKLMNSIIFSSRFFTNKSTLLSTRPHVLG